MAVQSVNAKTISRLKSIGDEPLISGDLFMMSHPIGGDKWQTYNTTLGQMVTFADNSIYTHVRDDFHLSGMNVEDIKNRVDNLYNANVALNGTKTFVNIPYIRQSVNDQTVVRDLPDNAIVTKKNVNDLLDIGGTFIGPGSKIEANPQNNSPNTNEDDHLLVWRIPDGMNDSTLFKDDLGVQDINGVACDKTGQLVVYGWLADGGGVLPQEAWVALYGKIGNKVNGEWTDGNWTILQLQPWVVSERSKVIQYVGFNIPVQKGLRLKIKTGFSVNSTATATNSGNSLVFQNVQHNTFVGYIVTQ